MLGKALSAPPAVAAPAQPKAVALVESVMPFPADPAVVAVTVTTPALDVADTPTLLPFPAKLIAAAKLIAWLPTLFSALNCLLGKSFAAADVKTRVPPIVIVLPLVMLAVKVPVWLADF